MKLGADDIHKDFFQTNKSIEFENILSSSDVLLLNEEILNAAAKRLSASKQRLQGQGPDKIFEQGRDLWRDSDAIKNLTFQRALAEIAYQLTGISPLRAGFEQYFPKLDTLSKNLPGKYQQFLQQPSPLKDVCSIQGVVCGLLIGFANAEEEKSTIFPSKACNAVFLHPEAVIPWPYLLEANRDYYLIVYAVQKSVYTKNIKDPLSSSFIQLGYSSGDRLNNQLNPIIYR